jgi:hypothetical protein
MLEIKNSMNALVNQLKSASSEVNLKTTSPKAAVPPITDTGTIESIGEAISDHDVENVQAGLQTVENGSEDAGDTSKDTNDKKKKSQKRTPKEFGTHYNIEFNDRWW